MCGISFAIHFSGIFFFGITKSEVVNSFLVIIFNRLFFEVSIGFIKLLDFGIVQFISLRFVGVLAILILMITLHGFCIIVAVFIVIY